MCQEDGINYLGWLMTRASLQLYFCASKSATGKTEMVLMASLSCLEISEILVSASAKLGRNPKLAGIISCPLIISI